MDSSIFGQGVSSGTEPPVSIVMPVRGEERYLREAVGHVLNQDYGGDVEVMIAVGPSRDRTAEIAAELAANDSRISVLTNPSGATPRALNAAIIASRHPIVARVDGHALLPRDYVRVAVETLRQTGADNVGGIMAAEGVTPFQEAVARAMTSKLGVGNAPFHVGGEPGPADTVYLGVFRRSALERVGYYDESFLRAQDWEMNYRIRQAGGLVWFQPRMRVAYRPRSGVRALAKQYFQYGRWRRVVARRHRGSINPRYLAPPTTIVAMAVGLVAALLGFLPGLVIPGGYVGVILAGSLWTGRGLPLKAWAWLPVVYVTMHCSWGAGFLTHQRRMVTAEPTDSGTAEPARPCSRAKGVGE